MTSAANGNANGETVHEAPAAPSPHVGVVLVTHDRPQLMRRALASVLSQVYDGDITTVIVYDRSEPETSLTSEAHGRRVTVMENRRSAGLAGARNTGVLHLDTDLVAFCDDDDEWLPHKLAAQIARLASRPDVQFVTTAMEVEYGGKSSVRRAGKDVVTIRDLARSRMAMLHSTSFLFRRTAMLDGFGLVDETLPRSMAEDWDLLIRAARMSPIQHVDEPLVRITWGASSYFNDAWHDKNKAHAWLAAHHPEIEEDRVGAGLIFGKLAFGHAVVGDRRAALIYSGRALRRNWHEPRVFLALLVAAGFPGDRIQAALNARGHGI